MLSPDQRLPGADVFVLPYRDNRYIVYAPVRGLVFTASAAGVEQLRRACLQQDLSLLPPKMVERIDGGQWLFEDDPLQTPLSTEASGEMELPAWQPCRVTLFLNTRCNLRCVYCYAEAGDRPLLEMDAVLWKAAVDLVVENARRLKKPVKIGFHGGGEPTLAWETLKQVVHYAEQLCRNHKPGLHFSLTTNGLLSDEKIAFISRRFSELVLSFDGPEDIQNRQRPRPDGSGSFDAVMKTAEKLHQQDFHFAIRSTITKASVHRMAEMVDFFTDAVQCSSLHFEPAFECGRCAGSKGGMPEYDVFADEFIRAFHRGIERRTAVRYSAARLLGRKLSFCGVARDSFNLTPDGLITACFEVCDASHPLADDFVYGRFDRDDLTFCIDPVKRKKLRALTVTNKSYCERCFCRWHCAGDCPVRGQGSQIDFQSPSPRCRMNRKITKAMLVKVIEDAS